MKLIVLTILVGFVLSDSSYTDDDDTDDDYIDDGYTDDDSVNLTWTEISGPTPKSILKKTGSTIKKSGRGVQFAKVCTYGGFKLQRVKELPNLSLRLFLLTLKKEFNSTDCTLSYQVENNDGETPFSVFRIDHQNETSNSSVYGIVTARGKSNFKWKKIKGRQFEHYLSKCDSKDGNAIVSLPRVLSCSQPEGIVTSPAPKPTPHRETTSTTPSTSATTSQTITSTTAASRITPPRIITSTHAPQPIRPQEVTPSIPPRGLDPEKSTTPKGWLSKLNCFKCL